MADNDDKIKISELDPALTLDNTSETVVNKQVSGSWVTFKMTIATLAAHILEAFASSSLTTTNKTVVGAINELQQGGGGGGSGSSTLAGLTDVHLTSPTNNQVLKYDSTSGKWINGDEQNFQPVIYSLEEREIGVWIDGKPLYEKTFNNITYGSQTTIDVSSLSIDTVVAFGGTNKETSNNNQSTFGYYNNSSDRTQYYYNASNDTVVIASTASGHGSVTIRYTKTTDTPGSGT